MGVKSALALHWVVSGPGLELSLLKSCSFFLGSFSCKTISGVKEGTYLWSSVDCSVSPELSLVLGHPRHVDHLLGLVVYPALPVCIVIDRVDPLEVRSWHVGDLLPALHVLEMSMSMQVDVAH